MQLFLCFKETKGSSSALQAFPCGADTSSNTAVCSVHGHTDKLFGTVAVEKFVNFLLRICFQAIISLVVYIPDGW